MRLRPDLTLPPVLSRVILTVSCILALSLGGVGCGGSFSGPGGPAGITLTPPQGSELNAGQQAQATAAVTDFSGRQLTNATVTWEVSDPKVMSATPVDAAGHTAKLVASDQGGEVTITARAGTQVASFQLTVVGAKPIVFSFQNDIQPIFTRTCALPECHGDPVDVAGESMLLTPGKSYSSIVNFRAHQVRPATIYRVLPGDSAHSYLVAKIKGTHLQLGGKGAQMPLDGSLPDADQQKIIKWIDAGAANN